MPSAMSLIEIALYAVVLGGLLFAFVVVSSMAYCQHLFNLQHDRMSRLEKRRLLTTLEKINRVYLRVQEADLTPWAAAISFLDGIQAYPDVVSKLQDRNPADLEAVVSTVTRKLEKLLESSANRGLTPEQVLYIGKRYGIKL